MNISCVPENTITATELYCSCFRGFYGLSCAERMVWYSPIMISMYILQTIVCLISLLWTCFSLHHNYKRNKTGLNLSTGASIIQFICIIIRLVYLWIPSRSVLLIEQSKTITKLSIVLVYIYIVLQMIICIICVNFWYDALNKLDKVQISLRTRWFVGVGSSSFLVGSIVGMILIIEGNILGSILVLAPMLANIIAIFVMLILFQRIDIRVLTRINLERRQWAIRSILVILIFWVIYFLSMASIPVLNMPNLIFLAVVPDLLFRICEIAILLGISTLLDFRFRSLRNEKKKYNTNTNTNSTESK